jgi:CysZ protein
MVFGISDVVVILAFYIAVSVSLLVLNLVPVLGTVLYVVLSTCLAWLMAALEFLGLPLNRRMTPFMVKWQAVWRNRWMSLGFGCAVLVLLFVPVLNLALLPLAAVGGTMFYLDLAAAGRLPDGVPGSGSGEQERG